MVRNRTFFMASFEHLRDVQPEPATYTVPTEAMRARRLQRVHDADLRSGDGDERRRAAAVCRTIRSRRAGSTAWRRPTPRTIRCRTVRARSSNYFTNQLRPYDYNAGHGARRSQLHRHQPSVRDRPTGTSARRIATTGRRTRPTPPTAASSTASRSPRASTTGPTPARPAATRRRCRSNLLLDVRGSWSRFGEYRDPVVRVRSLVAGVLAAGAARHGRLQLPAADDPRHLQHDERELDDRVARIARDPTGATGSIGRSTPIRSQPTVTRVWGGHTPRAGYDLRLQKWAITNNGFPGGRFQFNGSYTRANNTAALNDRAQSWAQFLLGLPTAATGAVATPATSSSQFEIAVAGRVHAGVSPLLRPGRLARHAEADRQSGAASRDQLRHARVVRSEPGRLRHHVVEPDRAAALAAYALNPIPEIPGVGLQGQRRPAVCRRSGQRDEDQAAATRGAGLLDRRSHGASRRRRPVLLRLLLREHQSDRLLAGHARADDAGQRASRSPAPR